jgi:hypothetical protein
MSAASQDEPESFEPKPEDVIREKMVPWVGCSFTLLDLNPDVDFEVDQGFVAAHVSVCKHCQRLVAAARGCN